MKVNILGTEYTVNTVKISECEMLQKERWAGCCSIESKEIIVADVSEESYFPYMSDEEQENYRRKILRHEIIHAFLNESGLSDSSSAPEGGWAKHEEMVDWFALQLPKIFEVFKEADCL